MGDFAFPVPSSLPYSDVSSRHAESPVGGDYPRRFVKEDVRRSIFKAESRAEWLRLRLSVVNTGGKSGICYAVGVSEILFVGDTEEND